MCWFSSLTSVQSPRALTDNAKTFSASTREVQMCLYSESEVSEANEVSEFGNFIFLWDL